MSSYQVSITTIDPAGRSRTARRNLRGGRPEDAVDVACIHLGLRRDLGRPVEPVGFWMAQARGARAFLPRSRRSGTVSPADPPATTSTVLARA